MEISKKLSAIAFTLILTMSTIIFSVSAEGRNLNSGEFYIGHMSHAQLTAKGIESDSARAVRECNNCGSGDLVYVKTEDVGFLDCDTCGQVHRVYAKTYRCRSCGHNSTYLVFH